MFLTLKYLPMLILKKEALLIHTVTFWKETDGVISELPLPNTKASTLIAWSFYQHWQKGSGSKILTGVSTLEWGRFLMI